MLSKDFKSGLTDQITIHFQKQEPFDTKRR